MNTVTLKLKGRIFIPGGYATKWPKEDEMPSIDGKPIIPSAQIKSGLRHAALRVIVRESGRKLPDVASYYFNAVGGVKGKKTEEEAKADTALTAYQAVRMKNPITGLFGSGDVLGGMYAGRIYVGNGQPEGDVSRGTFKGVRGDDSRRDPEGMMALLSGEGIDADIAEMHRINRERTAIKNEIKRLKRGFADKTLDADGRKKLNDDIRKKEDEMKALGGANAVSMPLEGFHYIVAPAFQSSLTLMSVTMEELGLLLMAMKEQMHSSPFLGAHRSSGFGEFSAFWESDEGTVTLNPFEDAVIQGSLFSEAVEAFFAGVDRFDLGKGNAKEVSDDED